MNIGGNQILINMFAPVEEIEETSLSAFAWSQPNSIRVGRKTQSPKTHIHFKNKTGLLQYTVFFIAFLSVSIHMIWGSFYH